MEKQFALIAVFWLITLQHSAFAEGKKYALLVGVSNYDPTQLNRLRYAEDDATELGKVLERLGFDVVLMTAQQTLPERVPMNADDILLQIDRRLKDKRPDDTVLISLSGHGVQLKSDPADEKGAKETYFCPQRARLSDKSTLVPLSTIMSKLEACPATRKLLLVDACRNEAASKDLAKSTDIELEPAGIARRSVPQGMIVLFSCQSKELSYELTELGHSAFTFYVLKYLKGEAPLKRYSRGQASIAELASYVSRETRDFIDRKLSKDQQPEFLSPGGVTDWELGKVQRSAVTVSATDRTADFATITEALKEVPPGGTIHVQEGIYREGLILNKPVSIIGVGDPSLAVIESYNSSCVVMNTTYATVKRVTLRCKATNSHGVDVPTGELTLHECDITSDSLACVAIHGGLTVCDLSKCHIHNGEQRGIYCYDRGHGTVSDCDIYENAHAGLSIDNSCTFTVQKCRIFRGSDVGINITSESRPTIDNCDIYENSKAGIEIREKADPIIRNCRIHDGKSIGIHVNGALSIIEECDIYQNGDVGITIHNSNSTIRKCRVHSQSTGGVLVCHASQGTIENCDVYRNELSGIEIREKSAPTIRNCRIHDSKQIGFFINDEGSGTIEECDIYRNGWSGVQIREKSDPIFRKCRIYDGKQDGVYVYNEGRSHFIDCRVTGNDQRGFDIEGRSAVFIKNCEITNNEYEGIRLHMHSSATAKNCDVSSNKQMNINVEAGSILAR